MAVGGQAYYGPSPAELRKMQDKLLTKLQEKSSRHETPAKVLRKTFQYFDVAGKGHITFQQFAQAIDRLGAPLTQQEVQDLFASSDMDGSGYLDYTEFSSMLLQGEGAPQSVPNSQRSNYNDDTSSVYSGYGGGNMGNDPAGQDQRQDRQAPGNTNRTNGSSIPGGIFGTSDSGAPQSAPKSRSNPNASSIQGGIFG